MFRIEGYCEDKYVAHVLRALSGVTSDLRATPVANAEIVDGKIVSRGELPEMFARACVLSGEPHVTATVAAAFLRQHGQPVSAAQTSRLLLQCVRNGALKSTGNGRGTKYMVIRTRKAGRS